MFRVRRFDYETVGAGRKPLQDVGRVKEDGDHDDREIRVLLLYAATEFVAINPRHQDVGQDDIRPRGLHLLYRLGTVARQYDIVASGIKDLADKLGLRPAILHNKNVHCTPALFHFHSASLHHHCTNRQSILKPSSCL